METGTHDIVQKLWNLCNILRDDGITYHEYVTELVYLLFLKMAQETGREAELPETLRWRDLVRREGMELLAFYRRMLIDLADAPSQRVRDVYENASTTLRKPESLRKLVESIDAIDWFSKHRQQLGELYEGLLEKNAAELKSGAGQYFTPRPLVMSMVRCVKPQPGEVVQDPAAGTAGFLVAADQYIKGLTDDLNTLPLETREFQRKRAFIGLELVVDTRRLALMNLMLHNIDGKLELGDTLTDKGYELGRADVVLTNPPFGTKQGGERPSRKDFTYPTSNKQLAFVEHVYRALEPGGRAAVIVPDNVLYESGVGLEIRRDLMNKCNLHTILRLPTGIFYAMGVKTNVLFFSRGDTDTGNTTATWVYDMRTNAPSFGKRILLTDAHFADFERAFGADPSGRSDRVDEGATGRWRRFSREELTKRGDNLDVTWLKDASANEALPEPKVIGAEILAKLREMTGEMEALQALLVANGTERAT